ncbi:MAG: hypothetical protein N4A74_20785 [Carboxylicivirga sp.]|jgi:hypothetical protein|nr:hypothetical protein [Carboxylicivirga sp.]
MDRKKQVEMCNQCSNHKFDSKSGIICGLTNTIYDFKDICENFNLDDKKVQNVADKFESRFIERGGVKDNRYKVNMIKIYWIAILVNLLPILISILNCSGEECMIVVIMIANWLFWLISYIPYLIINVANDKFKELYQLLFYIPSLIVISVFLILALDFFVDEWVLMLSLIVPNIIAQRIFHVYYLRKNKTICLIKNALQQWLIKHK